MDTRKGRGMATAAALFLAASARAQLSLVPAGSLRIEGDSTLHKWSSTATAVSMTFALAEGAPPALADAIKDSKIASMELKVSVAGLKSGESGLDKNMRAAMGADKFPDVIYKLGRYDLAKKADGAISAKTTGDLTISGKTKTVAMDVEFLPRPDAFEARGSYTLNMSDYGIKPPTLMLGTIKVRDPVTIRFDLLLRASDAAMHQKGDRL